MTARLVQQPGIVFTTVILAGILTAFTWFYIYHPFYLLDVDTTATSFREPLKEIVKDRHVQQTFLCRVANLAKIEILPGTFKRKNSSNLITEILDVNNNVIREIHLNCSGFPDTQLYPIYFSPITGSQNKQYVLSIKSTDGTIGNAIALWYTPEDNYAEGALTTNLGVNEGDLLFRTGAKVPFSQWYIHVMNKICASKQLLVGNTFFPKILFTGFIITMIIMLLYLPIFFYWSPN